MNGIIHAKELYRTDPNVRRNTIQNAFLALIESTKTLTDYFKNKGKLNFDDFFFKNVEKLNFDELFQKC